MSYPPSWWGLEGREGWEWVGFDTLGCGKGHHSWGKGVTCAWPEHGGIGMGKDESGKCI